MIHEDEVNALNQEAAEKVADRRKFLKSAGFTGLGLAAAGLAAGRMGALDNTPVGKALGLKSKPVMAAEDLDLAIFNFALNLEYLEAEFYSISALGKRLSAFSSATETGPTTGGSQVDFTVPGDAPLSQQLSDISMTLAYHEIEHVHLIRTTLGNLAVPKPAINLDALGIGFANVPQWLTLARAFEDTGLSAYNGAASLITSKAYLATAVQIALTESNHSGLIRYLCSTYSLKLTPTDQYDVIPPPGGTSWFYVTAPSALAVTRTTDQVLGIVYGSSASGTSKGGFYPEGMNGTITTIS